MTRANPAAVIETALERNRGADPQIAANAVLQALKAHHLRIVQDSSATITYCPVHTSTKTPCQMPHDLEGP